MRHRVFGIAVITVLTCATLARRADAQDHYGSGVRVGISGQPDQVYFGAHLDTPSLGHATTFRPNVELAFGGNTGRLGADFSLLTVDLELDHWMPLPDQPWKLYAGGGVGANFWSGNLAFDKGLHGDLNVVFGLQHQSGVFVEIKSGIQPRVKVAVGFVLK